MIQWRRSDAPEPSISRDDVLVIIGALADIKTWTHEIHEYLLDEDGEEEEDT
jgi:hypothetical protein